MANGRSPMEIDPARSPMDINYRRGPAVSPPGAGPEPSLWTTGLAQAPPPVVERPAAVHLWEIGPPGEGESETEAVAPGIEDKADERHELPVTSVRGIGPRKGERLSESGIDTVVQLVEMDPTDLAVLLDITAERAAELIERGWKLLSSD